MAAGVRRMWPLLSASGNHAERASRGVSFSLRVKRLRTGRACSATSGFSHSNASCLTRFHLIPGYDRLRQIRVRALGCSLHHSFAKPHGWLCPVSSVISGCNRAISRPASSRYSTVAACAGWCTPRGARSTLPRLGQRLAALFDVLPEAHTRNQVMTASPSFRR